MKYSIQPRSAKGINAGTKAVKDVSTILNEEGYLPFFCGSNYNGNHFYRLYILIYDLIRLYIKANKDDVFFIQWPYYNYFMPIFYWIIKKRCKNLQLLAHDINSLRKEKHGKWDFNFFNLSELIIVHSDAMKEYLIEHNISADKIKILTSFDYLTDDKIEKPRKNSNEIVYAGNLQKSIFLQHITENKLDIAINCYGKNTNNLGNGVVYKTSFQPEKVSILEGSWGLVWDGDSIEECNGFLGDYLKYNSPHKLSLYIVSELPIIIWEKAAMANYVKKQGIGICVSSIKEIPNKISAITEKEYTNIIKNIKKESYLLREGKHLKACLMK